MNAPIRSTAALAAEARNAQIERDISDSTVEAIAGLASGTLPKYLAPNPPKNLGLVSTFLILGALGKALVIVDDPEQIKLVEGRWKKRNIVGGSAIQLREKAASVGALKRKDTSIKPDQNGVFARMQILGRIGGKASGKTRRAKAERRKALQRVRSHAARKRWAKK